MADTITILVSTDNHVGYAERDQHRGDDSWKSFHEVMTIARERDVDMVLLAGDLFHENNPSRKSLYNVMRSLRMNCYGDKPCELEMLSDGTETFQGQFSHVNYEDPDINVAVPVFSIHGNHDDPSGEGHLAALDLLHTSGLINYYGRMPENDNFQIKPVLLQKGATKLALYGMSNVRDERLYRTFRDGKVKFFRPGTQRDNWFNIMSVHQNRHRYTETNYLPENFLPDFMDLVIWGHEHECLIEPTYDPATGFHLMQPGSTIATSLVPGEAKPKHVAILKVTGKSFECEPIPLKTVRPFMTKDIILREVRGMEAAAKKENNRQKVTHELERIVNEMIEEAKAQWVEAQGPNAGVDASSAPRPIVRLKVDYTPPEGGRFDFENPQRFSSRFVDKVANITDVVHFHRKKTMNRKAKDEAALPDLSELAMDTAKVEKLVREFLTAQSLTILPQNSFGDAVSQFVDKDDKHAMELFVKDSLNNQVKHLVNIDDIDDDGMSLAMEEYRTQLETLFAAGQMRNKRKRRLKAKPDTWDSDLEGHWEDQPGAVEYSDGEEDVEAEDSDSPLVPPRRAGGAAKAAPKKTPAANPRAAKTTTKKPAARKGTKGRVVQLDGEDDEESDGDFMVQ